MDWRTFSATFGAIFLAEMGDKTQLAAVTLAAQSGKPWTVFLGATAALAAVSAIGVIAGGALGSHLPLPWVKRAASLLFVAIGLLMFFDQI
jgi:Ca2+/H+ antiporter, TMEM165/GDT1 family